MHVSAPTPTVPDAPTEPAADEISGVNFDWTTGKFLFNRHHQLSVRFDPQSKYSGDDFYLSSVGPIPTFIEGANFPDEGNRPFRDALRDAVKGSGLLDRSPVEWTFPIKRGEVQVSVGFYGQDGVTYRAPIKELSPEFQKVWKAGLEFINTATRRAHDPDPDLPYTSP